ncbi:MAG: hypothetical protein B7Z80_02215 [Rhodospirillales bacterium 20-64-7]|nr:MAG: hypothetical protein B7Z80_02215 [Rhodospirillales bacterium 20-64-7]
MAVFRLVATESNAPATPPGDEPTVTLVLPDAAKLMVTPETAVVSVLVALETGTPLIFRVALLAA